MTAPPLRALVVFTTLCVGLVLFSSGRLRAQTATTTRVPIDANYARVEHGYGSATLSVFNVNRPLLEGLVALREEYGWRVNLEEPPHEATPHGGKFESTYPEVLERYIPPQGLKRSAEFGYSLSDASERAVLNKIVSDYNQAGFPGQYAVIIQSDGSYAVAGTAVQSADGTYQPVTPLLDTPISIPSGAYSLSQVVDLISKALSSATGLRVSFNVPGMWGTVTVNVGRNNIPARTLLEQAVFPGLVWNLYYEPRAKSYMLNLLPLRRAQYDISGQKSTLP
jgi:hypothetical protein